MRQFTLLNCHGIDDRAIWIHFSFHLPKKYFSKTFTVYFAGDKDLLDSIIYEAKKKCCVELMPFSRWANFDDWIDGTQRYILRCPSFLGEGQN